MIQSLSRSDLSGACTFAVDDVVAVATPIWAEPLVKHVARRLHRTLLAMPNQDHLVSNRRVDYFVSRQEAEASWRGVQTLDTLKHQARPELVNRAHSLINAVGTAFAEHRPSTLSPDCIWMVIEQGFSHHISENAEKFRSRLVRHQSQEELQATAGDLSLSSFESAIAQFSEEIRKRTDHVLHESLICDFSTTAPEVRTASEVVLMDCYSSYFTYAMTCICGIPSVTITGTLEDWQKIRARVEVFNTFELEWWVSRLRPILDEFIRAVEGNPSLEFWKAIYKPEQSYGTAVVTGWIADLFPYLNDPPKRRRNPILDTPRIDWSVPMKDGVTSLMGHTRTAQGISEKGFPSGLSSVPVKLNLPGRTVKELDFLGGFLAVEQSSQDFSLTPLISWCIADHAPSKPVMIP